jgi:hypothetical protein
MLVGLSSFVLEDKLGLTVCSGVLCIEVSGDRHDAV